MNMHIKSPGSAPGIYPIVLRGQGLKHISFTVLELGGTLKEHLFESGEEELAIDAYTGPVRVEVESSSGGCSTDIPRRASLRDAGPVVYVPADAKVRISSLEGPARVSISGALGKKGVKPAVISGDEIMTKVVGKESFTRTVYTHIADNIDAAHIIFGETISEPGKWSSCPPHKHDRLALPSEVPMEEVYYFQAEPKQGFGFIRVYTDPDDPEPFDYAFAVEDGDTVLIPRGYHPVVSCPGYTLNYTWILAGEGRTYGAWSDDPRHSWIKG